MPRPLRIVLVGLCYLVFGLFGVILSYVLLPLRLLGVRGTEARIAAGQHLLHVWSRRYFKLTRLLGIVRPMYPVGLTVPPNGAVIIANHPSLLDVVFIMAAIPRVTYVAKESWLTSPLIGRMLHACGHIGAPRGKTPADGAIALERMIGALEAGRALLVFPEGTRSPKNEMGPFLRGAFEAAVRTGSPIVPCIIQVDPPMLRKEQPWYDVADRRIEYRMRTLPILDPDSFGAKPKALVAKLEARYRTELGLPPAQDAAAAPAQAAP